MKDTIVQLKSRLLMLDYFPGITEISSIGLKLSSTNMLPFFNSNVSLGTFIVVLNLIVIRLALSICEITAPGNEF